MFKSIFVKNFVSYSLILSPFVKSVNFIPKVRWKVTVVPLKHKLREASMGASVKKIRNIGIMAHIDAGKTTTTERMLYYSGMIENPGEVHHGDTVTDFLPQERQRGITIQSAVVSFLWGSEDYTINLIDTPGHVDFTFEVQRSLRVVDGAIAILDASTGVEAQTLTVWRQASEYNLPRLIYLNKMDKESSSVQLCLDSIRTKLKCTPLLLQFPIYGQSSPSNKSGFTGFVDLISMKQYIFNPGEKAAVNYQTEPVSDDVKLLTARETLVEQVADFDPHLAEVVIERESAKSITTVELCEAIQRVVKSNSAVPVLIGSSYKNVGVQPLLDAIVTYLPDPTLSKSKDPVEAAFGNELCSYAFKTWFDAQLGPLTFIRVFSGTLSAGQKVYNITQDQSEKVIKLYSSFADELREEKEIHQGQVAIVSGLQNTFTGDTITSSNSINASVIRKLKSQKGISLDKAVLSGVTIPEPVFFCSIEPESVGQQKALDHALSCLQREDPSFTAHTDVDTGQTVLSGMGELHLEIIHGRLLTDYKLNTYLGKLQVAYKETITEPVTRRLVFERKLADRKHSVTIEILLEPMNTTGKKLKLEHGRGKEVQENLAHVKEHHFKCVENGVKSTLRHGPKLGFPVINVQPRLNFLDIQKGTSDTIIQAAAASCTRQCLLDANIQFLEPIVDLEITLDPKHQHRVMDDLNRRRFTMQQVYEKHENVVINGCAPLKELMGYSTALRKLSSGLGSFSMQLSHYELVTSGIEENKIIEDIRGF